MANFECIIRNFVDRALEINKGNKSCHIALLLQGKRKIRSYGFNQMNRQCYQGKPIYSLHAEIDCLRKCRPIKNIQRRNYSLVVVKVAKNNTKIFHDSFPCKHCTKFLINVGIKNVYCSDKNGKIIKICLNEYKPYNLV